MSKISVGDLVQVIRPAECGCTTAVGITRTVIAFVDCFGRCASCGHNSWYLAAVLDGEAPWSNWHIPLNRLKRIPPLEELEGEKRDEEITA